METVAELVARTLVAHEITTVFGLPGGENVPLLEALRRHNIEFVLVKNESSAVYMAAVTARLTGVPGVALSTLGPGAANAFAGLAHAHLDRCPVLLLTAQTDLDMPPQHTHQVLDLQASFAPITKLTRQLTPASAESDLQAAWHALTTGRPGPVHLSMSRQVLVKAVLQSAAAGAENSAPQSTAADDVLAAQNLLQKAQRLVIVTGLGLEPERPYAALRQLAESLGAPVIDTPKSKGALPADHPLAVGTIGLTQQDPAYQILDEADCIIAVGFDVVELVRPWDYAAPLIWIAPWPNVDPVLDAAFEFVGDLTPILESLAVESYQPVAGWGHDRVADYRRELAAQSYREPAAGTLAPSMVLKALREVMPPETLLTTDVGSHKIYTALNWQAVAPNRYMVSNGLSCMGYGLPAAIAAARVLDESVVCITGDGGLAMNMGELGLLMEDPLPVIVVLMNDNALDLIRFGQLRDQLPVFGTEFQNPNYEAVLQGYGLNYCRVNDVVGCVTALQTALQTRRPWFIDAIIDPAGYRA